MVINNEYEVDLALMSMQLIVFIIGLVGNVVVILVILILKEYKKAVTHWYVLQLAIADTLFLSSIPFRVVENWNDEWIFTVGLCKLKETALFLNYYSSILFLMTMSLDRYIAVCHGLSQFQKLRTPRASYIIAAIIWLSSLLMCIPVMLQSTTTGVNPKCKCRFQFPINVELYCKEELFVTDPDLLKACISDNENLIKCTSFDFEEWGSTYDDDFNISYYNEGADYYITSGTELASLESSDKVVYNSGCSYENQPSGLKVFLVFNFLVMFVIPFLVMSACYTLIAIRLNKSRARSGSKHLRKLSTGSRKRAMSQADRSVTRVTIICGILVILFFVCWFPYHVVHLTKMKGMFETSEFCQKIVSVTSLLGFINSALNPYIYNFIGTKFRRRLRSAFGTVKASVVQHSSGSMSLRRRNGSRNSNAQGSHIVKQKSSMDATSRTSMPDSVFVNEKLDTTAPLVTVSYNTSNEALTIKSE